MTDVSKDTAYQIRADLYKTFLTLDLALLAGVIALLQTLIENGSLTGFAYASALCLTLSAICAIGALQVLASMTSPEFNSNDMVSNLLLPKSARSLIFLDGAAGGLTGIGLVMLVIFALAN